MCEARVRLAMSSSALPLSFFTKNSSTNGHGPTHHTLMQPKLPDQIQQWSCEEDANSSTFPKIRTIRYRLSHLCREGQPHVARQLFDSIPRPTTVLWNTMIIGLICNNMPYEALLLYSRMKSSVSSFKTDPYTFSSTLKACAETKQLRIGKAVHCHILRSNVYPSRIVSNSLLNMYATCLCSNDNEFALCSLAYTRYDLVRRVFDSMRKRNVVAWNIMISWYVKTKRFVEGVGCFTMMLKMGIRPTAVSFVNVFSAVSALRDANIANVFYGLLVKFGNTYVEDMFAVSSAIIMYAELDCLDLARKVFDHCLEKNVEVWNTMISAYIQNNRPLEALDLFLKAVELKDITGLDHVTFLSVLSAASQLQLLDIARQIHAYITKSPVPLLPVILNAIVVMYSRCNSVETSFEVFNWMEERDVVSWNTMISAFVQNGFDVKGLMLVYEMQKHGFIIDSVAVTALLSAASNLRNREIGKQTHAYLLRHGIEFEGMESYLIDMYAKSGLIKAAESLFEKNCTNHMDQATWNAMIAGNTQNGLLGQAFSVFRRMLKQNVKPNSVTVASILPACSLGGNVVLGKQLHGFCIRNSLDENVFVVSAFVDMYSKSGAISYAETVFALSSEKNSVTYTNMILGYGQHGLGEKALDLFYSMSRCGIKPDAITFTAVLSACSYTGLVDEGLHIFESMEKEHNIQPSIEHYCCVADLLGRVGRVAEAYEFVKELPEKGNMLGIWGSLLSACKIHGELELGKIVAKKLLTLEADNSKTGYRVLLSNIFAEEGSWENVNRVREAMRERGLTKEVGRSWIDITGNAKYFSSRDQKHAQRDKIYEMLEELTTNMRNVGYRPCVESSDGDCLFESQE